MAQPEPHSDTALLRRVQRFLELPAEQPWLEFKVNSLHTGPDIAKYVSALGNSARLHGEPAGYLLWGISDSREPVGTTFNWQTAKGKGNEDLEPWLTRVISPTPSLEFSTITVEGKPIVLLRVEAPTRAPYSYEGKRWFRVGSHTKDLLKFPEAEQELWRQLNQFSIEDAPALTNLAKSDILDFLSAEAFFHNRPELPHTSDADLPDIMRSAGAVSYTHEDGWSIPTWAALMYATKLSRFPRLEQFIPRVLHFEASTRISSKRQWEFDEGFASSFGKVMTLFETIRPGGESFDPTTGRIVQVPTLPTIAFREVYANALMHQDLDQTGKFLMVEVFADRVEVTNPGTPLISPKRFIDAPSTTRNPKIGTALRQAQFVEQRGSGWDKVVQSLESEKFPPALVRANGSTTVSLSAFRPFALLSQQERQQAVYQHACLAFLEGRVVNNSSIRARLGLKDSQASQVSRLLKECIEEELIKPHDPHAGPRAMHYIPAWA
ncbi:Divergent AAA domain protein [Corynebacterium oculi]|uniref:Divergent AAA domain protein n=2 Tax=Corynebacterium oculi TaxID=1544416 RepID=A0A0Q1DVY0_9CORY|nr:Divergent AAA domain protein [Corynebacterium oculi]